MPPYDMIHSHACVSDARRLAAAVGRGSLKSWHYRNLADSVQLCISNLISSVSFNIDVGGQKSIYMD